MDRELRNEHDDEILLRSLANGESKAFHFIYKTIYPSVEKMVFKMRGSTDDAFDIFQDAVTIVYQKAQKGDLVLSSKFSTFLIAVARRLWLNKISSQKIKMSVLVENDGIDFIHLTNDIELHLEFETKVDRLKSCLDQLGDPCKTLLNAFYFDNKNMNEIADLLGYTNAENAKSQKYKCLNRIRSLFFTEKEKNERNERITK
ncbi:MAG TPA: sigma-70 family RNA polymerase sigma factor [Chitinophagaceae bacterium]|nr:sigma-70 family RNA polymerase sigma factor [Chitinophagaceae bacterium]